MPIYEFDCLSCGDSFDKLVRRPSAASTVICPNCESADIKKKISVFSNTAPGGTLSVGGGAGSCAPGGL